MRQTATALILLALLPCCTVMTGNGTGYTYASLGGNAEGLNISPGGASATKIDNATGAAIAKEAISDAASAYVMGKMFDAAGKLIEEGADVLTDNNDTDVEINESNNAAKVETETFVPPEPVVPE
jgi:hypothetical protein